MGDFLYAAEERVATWRQRWATLCCRVFGHVFTIRKMSGVVCRRCAIFKHD